MASLAGRELPGDIVQQVSNLTMGQLFYILGHIQKLSAQAPVTAQALLAENPQICYALLHAECLAGMIEEPLLPMTGDELQRAKAKARQIREELEQHELPPPPEVAAANARMQGGLSKSAMASPPAGVAPPPPSMCGFAGPPPIQPPMGPGGFFCKAGSPPPPPPPPPHSMPFGMVPGMPAGFPLPPVAPLGMPPPPMTAPPVAAFPEAAPQGDDAQKQDLMQKLVQLTPEQIARLPEHTKVQLLSFLQQNASQS